MSIKRHLPAPPRKPRFENGKAGGDRAQNKGGYSRNGFARKMIIMTVSLRISERIRPLFFDTKSGSGNADFEDMLSKFKATSEERFSDLKHVIDNKRKSASRRK